MQAERRVAEICKQFDVSRVLVVQFVRGSRRLFFIVPSPAHDEILRERTIQLLASPWGQQGHFQPVLELA